MTSLVAALLGSAAAATIVVDPSGGGDTVTIGEAAALAVQGDSVEIQPGTYFEEDVDFNEGISILGAGPELTMMDGASALDYGMYIRPGTVLSGVGFTGYQEAGLVAISMFEGEGSIQIQDGGFWSNRVGIMAETTVWTEISISNSRFAEQGFSGVQTYDFSGNLSVENCQFIDDYVGVAFGVWTTEEGSTARVNQSTFVGAKNAIYATSASGKAVNLYAFNNVFAGGAVSWNISDDVSGEVSHNLTGVDLTTGALNQSTTLDDSTNSSGDPLFADRSDDGDWTNDDLHLLLGSAAIDIGVDGVATLPTDLDGISRPVDGDADGTALPDAGAYEFVRLDEDGDGSLAASVGGEDCDDADPTILPGVDDPCGDGVDQDCDGADPPCGRDTGLADTGGGPGEEPGGDTASPQDSGSPTEDTGPVEGDSGRDSASGGGDAPGGEAAPPPCGCAGRQALVLWPLWLLVARRRRRAASAERGAPL